MKFRDIVRCYTYTSEKQYTKKYSWFSTVGTATIQLTIRTALHVYYITEQLTEQYKIVCSRQLLAKVDDVLDGRQHEQERP